MPWEFTEHHVRPNVLYWSPKAHAERQQVKGRQQEAARSYRQAQGLLKSGQPKDAEAAEKLLQLAIAAWPDNPVYLCTLADCITHQRNQPERALPWYDQLVEAADSPAHRIARARAYAAMGCLEEAMMDLEVAIAADATNGGFLKERGLVRMRQGQISAAALDFTAALPWLKEQGEPMAPTLFNRGYCHRLLMSTDEAIKDMESALQMAPSVTAIKMALGSMYEGRRRYRDAMDLFQVVMSFRRHSAAAANNLALAEYLLATAEDRHAQGQGATKRREGSLSTAVASDPKKPPGQAAPAAGGQDAMSDDDGNDDADRDAMLAHAGKANEDPRHWALSVIKWGARRAAGSEPAQRALLEASLNHFNLAAQLYTDDAARARAQARSEEGVHAVHENEPVSAHDGYLIMLTNKVRVPGTSVVHDRELEDGEIQYNRGLVHLVLGNLVEAEADFQDALAANPTHAHYPHFRAVVHGRKGELKEAVYWNQSALALNPMYPPALYHLGLCLYLQGRNAEAIQRLDSALGQQPKNWRIMEARGRVLQELDRHAEALPSLRDALNFCDPDEPPTILARLHYAIAQSAIATHAPDLLRSALREARLHGQDPASVYALRGLLAHRESKLSKALAYLSRAIRLAPKEARFLYDRSQVLLDLQDWHAAAQDMSAALSHLPDSAFLFYSRGMVLFAMGEDARALKDFEAAAQLIMGGQETPTCPSPAPSHLAFRSSHQPSRPSTPTEQLQQVHSGTSSCNSGTASTSTSHPRTAGALQAALPIDDQKGAKVSKAAGAPHRAAMTAPAPGLGVQRLAAQHVDQQAALQQSASYRKPTHHEQATLQPDPRVWEGTKFMSNASAPPDLTPSLWYHLGICRARQAAWAAAAAAFEQAVACLPRHPALLHELAKTLQAMNDHQRAVQVLSSVLQLQPGNARALFRRGISRHALKLYEEAAADLESARRLGPADSSLHVDYRTLGLSGAHVLGRPGEEAVVWDLAAFP